MSTTNESEATFTLSITPDGTIQFLWDDALALLLQLGEGEIKRASYVEPQGSEWTCDLHPAGGPVLGPFPLRNDALAAERNWLERRMSYDNLD